MPKVDPRTEIIKIFIIAYTHNIGIQVKRKKVSNIFMMISNCTGILLSMVYTKIFHSFKG